MLSAFKEFYRVRLFDGIEHRPQDVELELQDVERALLRVRRREVTQGHAQPVFDVALREWNAVAVSHAAPWSASEFETRLRALGAHYDIHHPFNLRMNNGWCSPEQIRGWVANRFYYQINIPLKDAAILSNCPDRDTRRLWIQRLLDVRVAQRQ